MIKSSLQHPAGQFLNLSAASLICPILVFTSTARMSVAAVIENTNVVKAANTYAVVERGSNYKLWSKGVGGTPADALRTNHYYEIATGMHRKAADGSWIESNPRITVQPQGGAVGTGAACSISFPGDIYAGSFELTMPNGETIVTRPVGLSLSDGVKNVLVSELKQGSSGQILPDNQTVMYSDTCSGGPRLDLRCRYRRAGYEDDLIIREQIGDVSQIDETFTNADNLVLQWWTEIISGPEPQVIEKSNNRRLADSILAFKSMTMVTGRGFLLGDQLEVVPVSKMYVLQDNRRFLVEQVPLSRIQAKLVTLPPRQASISRKPKPHYAASGKLPLPRFRAPRHSQKTLMIAKNELKEQPGLLIDYTIVTSDTNVSFNSSSTYVVSDDCYLSGNTTIYGGATFKFGSGVGSLNFDGTLTWRTRPYSPAVFTAVDDDNTGEPLGFSTGSPSGYYGNIALNLDGLSNPSVSNARFAFILNSIFASADSTIFTVEDVQFLNCSTAIFAVNNCTVSARNILAENVGYFIDGSNRTAFDVENLTLDGASYVAHDFDSGDSFLYLTNSLISGVSNFSNFVLVEPDHVVTNATSAGLFQTIGGGAYYLASNSPYRNAGTTNIDATLLASLRKKTTFPPLVFISSNFTSDRVFSPVVQRDTDPNPALGYHYDPLDLVFSDCDANANLTFAPGTAVGWFRTTSDWYHAGHGIHIGDSNTLTFNGTFEALDYFVRCNTVQEGGTGLWDGGYGPGGLTGWAWPDTNSAPQVNAKFTTFAMVGRDGNGNHFRDDNGWLTINLTDCEVLGGGAGFYNGKQNYTNCFFEDAINWLTTDQIGSGFSMENCTCHYGYVGPTRFNDGTNNPASIRDSVFDHTLIGDTDTGSGGDYYDYNAFLTNFDRTVPNGAHDLIVTNFNWQSAFDWNYYIASDSPLIDAGAVPATTNGIGLCQFTIRSDQTPEATSAVDLGYHRVALDYQGNPNNYDGDATPDYLEDLNGNGIADSGEPDWQNGYDPGLKVTITRPSKTSNIP
jgi:hypothetical protein